MAACGTHAQPCSLLQFGVNGVAVLLLFCAAVDGDLCAVLSWIGGTNLTQNI